MVRSFYQKFSNSYTAKPLRALLFFIGSLNCILAFIQTFCDHFLPQIHLKALLGMSYLGLHKGYLWQIITSLFLDSYPMEMSSSFLMHLTFVLYITWSIGSVLYPILGMKRFYLLFFVPPLVSTCVAVFTTASLGIFAPVCGFIFSIFSLLTIWIMQDPRREMVFLSNMRCRALWLVIAYFAISLFLDVSNWHLGYFFGKITAILIGYLYGTLFLGFTAPFTWMRPLDSILIKTGHIFCRKQFSSAKIYDIQTGNPQTRQEAFLDSVLEKISTEGKKSLTFLERIKLRRISKKRRKNRSADE